MNNNVDPTSGMQVVHMAGRRSPRFMLWLAVRLRYPLFNNSLLQQKQQFFFLFCLFVAYPVFGVVMWSEFLSLYYYLRFALLIVTLAFDEII